MRIVRPLLVAILIFGSGMLAACSARRPADVPSAAAPAVPAAPSLSLAAALRDVRQAAAPAGVDPAVWDQLRAELVRVLKSRQTSKFVAAPPAGPRNLIADFGHDDAGAQGQFAWTYLNAGDYDQNSEVNIADLTPIGQHFGKLSSAPDWASAQLADGDTNGEVNIADVTPIGMYYTAALQGYELQTSASNEAGAQWTAVEDVPFTVGAVPGGGGRKRFAHSPTAELTDQNYYRVAAYQGEAAGRLYGEPSNAVQVTVAGGDPGPSPWNGPDKSGYMGVPGPQSAENITLTTSGDAFRTVKLGSDGNLYVDGLDDKVYSLGLDGVQRWAVSVGPRCGAYCLGADDTTYVVAMTGAYTAINAGGSVVQQAALPEGCVDLSSSPSGGLAAISLSGSLLYFGLDGAVAWEKSAAGGAEYCACVCLPNGTVAALTRAETAEMVDDFDYYDNRLLCYSSTGAELWDFNSFGPGSATGDVYARLLCTPDNWLIMEDCNDPRGVSADGITSWTVDGEVWEGTLSVGPDGNVYFGTCGAPSDSVEWVASDGTELGYLDSPGDVRSPVAASLSGRVWWADDYEGGLKTYLEGEGAGIVDANWRRFRSACAEPSGDAILCNDNLCRYSADSGLVWYVLKTAMRWSDLTFRQDGMFYIYVPDEGLKLMDLNQQAYWTFDPGGEEAGIKLVPMIAPSGDILARGLNHLFCLNADGQEKWSYTLPGSAAYLMVAGSGGESYVVRRDEVSGGDDLIKVDSYGAFAGSLDFGAFSIIGVSLLRDPGSDRLFISATDFSTGYLRCVGPDLQEIYTFTPPNGGATGPAAIDQDGYAFLPTRLDDGTGAIYRVDPAGGLSRTYSPWMPLGIWDPPAVSAEGDIAFLGYKEEYQTGAEKRHVVRLDQDGNELWAKRTNGDSHSDTPIVDSEGNTYYVASGNLYCIARDGTENWRLYIRDPILPYPGPDGTLYLGLSGGLLAIHP